MMLMRQVQRWHWISAALSLLGLMLFAITGITLNHASQIESKPRIETKEAALPADVLAELKPGPQTGRQPLPARIEVWLAREMAIKAAGREAEWSAGDVYVALPRPGGDAWVNIDRRDGAITYEVTDRGWISYFNDLHKGRHTGVAWMWFIDLFAVACIVFTVTGVILLQLHAASRPSTWPTVALGVVIPLLLIVLFIH